MVETDKSALLLDEVLALEHRVWRALKKGDVAADHSLLSEDFLGVYPSGFATRKDHTGQLADGPTIESYALSDVRLRPIGEAYALLTYLAHYQRQDGQHAEKMYVSSLWHRQQGGWCNVFSQDTPAND